MNRIKISPLAAATFEKKSSDDPLLVNTTRREFSLPDNHIVSDPRRTKVRRTDEYSLFVPLHFAENYHYPLVVWLHDDGDTSEQLHRIMPWLSLQNYVGVAPQSSVGNLHHGFYWEQTRDSIECACEAVASAIERASRRINIASDRIYVAGSGNAGTMAFRIAMDRPELFKGVVSINGPLPQGLTPFSKLGQCRFVEVFWAHCRNSIEFPEPELCQQLRMLHAAGFSTTLRQYPCGDRQIEDHDRRFDPLGDLNRWIMSDIESSVA